MDDSFQQWAIGVMSGSDRTAPAGLTRVALAMAEPFYAQAMAMRNFAYRNGLLRTHELPRPVVSIGNLTTGGTGKTPVVRWLAERLIAQNQTPAILLRGYRGEKSAGSDEAKLLADTLGARAQIVANPDRRAGAMSAMRQMPQPDVFLLDDAFQHRKVARDFDLVLIDATRPFGFDHVLPRGLMREPMRGLRRADAVLVTRFDQATAQELAVIEARLRRYRSANSIHFARHALTGLRVADDLDMPLADLAGRRFFAFAGVGNPQALRQQLDGLGTCAGFATFGDHHAYTDRDLAGICAQASEARAQTIVTTEKDWVKIRHLPPTAGSPPIARLELRIEFRDRDEERLLSQIFTRIERRRSAL